MKGKWLTYVVVMVMIVGCVDYSMQKDSGVSAFSGNILYKEESSPIIQQTVQIADNFPNTSVVVALTVDIKKYDEQFVNSNRERMESVMLLYLADKSLNDFKGTANLQKIADDLKSEFNSKLGLTGTTREILKVWLTQVAVSREKK